MFSEPQNSRGRAELSHPQPGPLYLPIFPIPSVTSVTTGTSTVLSPRPVHKPYRCPCFFPCPLPSVFHMEAPEFLLKHRLAYISSLSKPFQGLHILFQRNMKPLALKNSAKSILQFVPLSLTHKSCSWERKYLPFCALKTPAPSYHRSANLGAFAHATHCLCRVGPSSS